MMRLLTSLVILAVIPAAAVAQDPELAQIKARELEQVREKISALKSSMDERVEERDRLTGELQTAELLIAEKRAYLRDLEQQYADIEKKKVEIEDKLARLEEDLAGEMGQLAAQVKAAYTSGSQERLKLLLNHHDPATMGRLLTYYRYMSEYRGKNIENVKGYITELAKLRAEAAAGASRLAALANTRAAELRKLDAAQASRQALLTSLKARIADESAQIDRLAAEEKDLARLIAELMNILSDYPITSEEPFSNLKGNLTWPVAGSVIHDFGQPRAGGSVTWKGVVLAAPRGHEVRSIYHGRVVFAGWLVGMGLLVIIDHGEDYLTLYGYNETILKTVGDWVAPGDVIATVGDSGGQQQTGLYFEVRKGTRPQNPRQWASLKPKTGY